VIKNPYHTDKITWKELQEVKGYVSPNDVAFLKTKFPWLVGGTDKLISNLYKKLIDELRRIDSITPIEPAWTIDHPSHDILAGVIERCSFGKPVGQASPRDEQRGVGGVREEVRSDEKLGPDTEGRTPKRGRKSRSGKKEENGKEGQRATGSGTPE
jgi:hypothetical protein